MIDGWIGVDLDGTLARYDKWNGANSIGEPVPAMVARVRRWLAENREVRIFTARVSGGTAAERRQIRLSIRKWCKRVIGQELPITNIKDYEMIELWDDRVVAVEPNTGRPLNPSRRGLDERTISDPEEP